MSDIIIPEGADLPPMNDYKKRLIEQYIVQKQFHDELLYRKGLEDLFVFNKFVLGVEKGKEPLGQFHKELCHFVTNDIRRKKLLLLPRGHLKSTLITIGYCLQRIVQNPNIRILILNATWQMSVDFLSEIKRHLEQNETLRELYTNKDGSALADNPIEWAQDRITLKRTDQNIKGPTVWAAGVESNLVGSHPDMIIFDDVVNRDNSQTREHMEKVILRYKDALDLLEPGGQLIVIGTRWSEADLYSWLLDKEAGIIQSYDVMIKKAYSGNIETGEDFQALWPAKFTTQELKDRLREKGLYEFSAQYMNDPVPAEDADFKRAWFKYYDREEVRGKQMRTVATIDPAISLNKDADYTAIGVTGIDQFSNLFIKDLFRKRMKPSEIIDTIFKLDEMWHPDMWILETIAYQKALAYSLNEEMRKRRRYLPITEVNQHERSKDQRIRGLQPVYMAGQIFHPRNHPMVPYLEEELIHFPRGRHDDLVDALSMALDFLTPPRPRKTRYQHKYLY
jgi:predicted phage terminase large subunit-like protein